jgi:hypothetical protein
MKLTPRILLLALLVTGCAPTAENSNLERSGEVAAGAALGAGVGLALKPGSTTAALIGGAVGAGATLLALGPDRKAEQAGYEEGYDQASSDSIKRHYWLQQGLQRFINNGGQTTYYTFQGPQQDADGTKYVPHPVTVPIQQ